MKKLILPLLAVLATVPASADLNLALDCTVAKIIDDTVFEEGLSKHEYPAVYIEKNKSGKYTSASIGMVPDYDVSKGAIIVRYPPTAQNDRVRYFIKRESHNGHVLISVANNGPRPGSLWASLSVKDSNVPLVEVALLICKANPRP